MFSVKLYPRVDTARNIVALKAGFTLKKNEKDQWFILRDKRIAFFEEVREEQGKVFIEAKIIARKRDFYLTPIKSSFLDIYESDGEVNTETIICSSNEILAKMFKIVKPDTKSFVFFPLRHSYLELD